MEKQIQDGRETNAMNLFLAREIVVARDRISSLGLVVILESTHVIDNWHIDKK